MKMFKNTMCQTIFRESDTQTDPWLPKYITHVEDGKTVPEVLGLTHFTWGKGLPFGKYDALKVDRLRKRKAWEAYIIKGKFSNTFIKDTFSQIQNNDIDLLEQEFDVIIAKRLELAQYELKQQQDIMASRKTTRISSVITRNEHILMSKRHELKKHLNRGIRMVNIKNRDIFPTRRDNLLLKYLNKTSDVYVIPARFGQDHKLKHEKMSVTFNDEFDLFCKLEDIKALKQQKSTRSHRYHICDSTYWPPYQYKSIDAQKFEKKVSDEIDSSTASPSDKTDDQMFKAIELIQKVLEDQASQSVAQLNRLKRLRDKDVLRENYGFTTEDITDIKEHRLDDTADQSRQHAVASKILAMIMGTINQVAGSIISSTLDFSHKEFERILNEQTIYNLIKSAHEDRWRRESMEAGLRQKELRRRRQHEEMTRHVAKAQQQFVDQFLLNVMNEALEVEAKLNARVATQNKAEIDDPRSTLEDFEIIDRDVVTTRLFLSHLLPEPQCIYPGKKVSDKQEKFGYHACREIFGSDEVPEEENEKSEEILNALFGENDHLSAEEGSTQEEIKDSVGGDKQEPRETLFEDDCCY